MSDKTIKFEIVTPEEVILKDFVVRITVPTTSGEVTILPNHIPLISVLTPGIIETEKENGEVEIMVVSGGFLEVLNQKVVILADYAQRAISLDEKIVEEARNKAEKAKNDAKNKDNVEFANISAKLEIELLKNKALSRWRKLKNTSK